MSKNNSKIDELIQIVDEQDNPVGAATKPEAWRDGLIHRIVRVVVLDTDGKILLQKRVEGMQLYPGCWDQSASGHVDAGEEYNAAATRELAEEIGLKDASLEECAYYYWEGKFEWRILKRFTKIYKIVVPVGINFEIEKEEVAEVRWFTVEQVQRLVEDHPNQVTDGLAQVLQKLYK